jgi:hypothetical protein
MPLKAIAQLIGFIHRDTGLSLGRRGHLCFANCQYPKGGILAGLLLAINKCFEPFFEEEVWIWRRYG